MNLLKVFFPAIAMIVVLVAAPSARGEGMYTLSAGDEIAMVVYGEKELSGSYKVGGGGTIAVPLIGEVSVGGLHLRAAEQLVAAKLADGYLVEPSVTMQVTSARPIYILGEVKNPGSYSYAADMTVLNAVALAGGFTYRAKQSQVTVTRGEAEEKIAVEMKIQPGDIITVDERFF